MQFLFLALLVFGGWWLWEKSHRKTHPVSAGHHPEIEIPFEQDFELYHNALSLCSMKSRVCMAELGIPYKSHSTDLIETGAYENIRRDFLAVNPAGTVPVLVHKGHPIYESHEQIRYAADHAPPGTPSLVPEDPDQQQVMQRWIDRSSITHDPIEHGDASAGNAVPGLTLPIFTTMVERIPVWKIVEGLLFHFDRRRPVVFLLLKLRGIEKLPGLGAAVKVLRRSQRQMAAHLDALESQLGKSGGPWILGEAFTLADVSWLVIFERLAQVDSLQAFLGDGKRLRCTAYWESLKQRPSYAEAILGHPHPTIEYGTKRIREAKAANPALRALLEAESA
jgi:glutathione S-transferase